MTTEQFNEVINFSCLALELVNLFIKIPQKAYLESGVFDLEYSKVDNEKKADRQCSCLYNK